MNKIPSFKYFKGSVVKITIDKLKPKPSLEKIALEIECNYFTLVAFVNDSVEKSEGHRAELSELHRKKFYHIVRNIYVSHKRRDEAVKMIDKYKKRVK
jgi:hypothetical protein